MSNVCRTVSIMEIVLLLCSMMMFSTCSTEKQKTTQMQVLVVTGGHGFERDAFFRIIESYSDIEYKELVQPEANQFYSSPSIKEYDALVLYDMVQEITDEQKKAFIRLLENGKGVVFLHHSLASYQDWDEFEKIIGGRYLLESKSKDGEEYPASTFKHDVDVPVKIIDVKHPVTKGMSDFIIHDEVYGYFKVLPQVHPLLSTTHSESGKIIGWTNHYGNSRIVYIQLGHDHQAYGDHNYRRLVRQAIEWVAGRE